MTNHVSEHDKEGWLIDDTITLPGAMTGPSGVTYVCLRQRDKTKWIKRSAFADGGPGFTIMKDADLLVFTPEQRNHVLKLVSGQTYFWRGDIVEGPGWGPLGFGYPDGRLYLYSGTQLPSDYVTGAVCVSSTSTLIGWRTGVARFVREHFLLVFCIMAAFAAPLLSLTRIQGNFMLMLSGPPRKGKTTCVDVMASVCGPALDSPGGRYYLKFNNTMNRIEEWLPIYSDMPLIIDELSSHGTKSSRMTDFRTLVHHLAGVDARGRMGDKLNPAVQTRTLILMTSNDTASELLGLETAAAAEAVEDRLIELPVPRGAEGAFNGLEPDEEVARQYSDNVRARVERHHGTAMPAFLEALVRHRNRDEPGLRDGIARRMSEFSAFPEVRLAMPISGRILDVFGLIYAAGELAKRYDVLPASFDCRAAAIHCLRLHLGLRAESDPVQRLLAWVSANEIIDLRATGIRSMSDNALHERGAFIGERSGLTQLWINPVLFRRSFSGARDLLRALESRNILQTEGRGERKHNSIKCTVRREKAGERFYVFNLPDFPEWLDKNGYPQPSRIRRKR